MVVCMYPYDSRRDVYVKFVLCSVPAALTRFFPLNNQYACIVLGICSYIHLYKRHFSAHVKHNFTE